MSQIILLTLLKAQPRKTQSHFWFTLKSWYTHFQALPAHSRWFLTIVFIIFAALLIIYIVHLANQMMSNRINSSEISNRTQHDREIRARIARENRNYADQKAAANHEPSRFKIVELLYQLFH